MKSSLLSATSHTPKQLAALLLFCAALTLGCARKNPDAEVKENLMKAMAAKLQNSRPDGTPPFHFEIMDVAYFKLGDFYRCEFKVKLRRADGTDTTGIVKSKISTDYSRVVK